MFCFLFLINYLFQFSRNSTLFFCLLVEYFFFWNLFPISLCNRNKEEEKTKTHDLSHANAESNSLLQSERTTDKSATQMKTKTPPVHYTVKRFNYASSECGAKVLRTNPEARVRSQENKVNNEIEIREHNKQILVILTNCVCFFSVGSECSCFTLKRSLHVESLFCSQQSTYFNRFLFIVKFHLFIVESCSIW
jgi:hypothetical protein